MPATTPGGFPYAIPADPLVTWPATSQSLAEKAEFRSGDLGITSTAYAEPGGIKTVAHGLGRVPTAVLITPGGADTHGGQSDVHAWHRIGYVVYDVSVTSFRVVVVDLSTGIPVESVQQQVAFYWHVS